MTNLMYLDFFNGMSDQFYNANTIRLYYTGYNGAEQYFIASCPYTRDVRFSIKNEYGETKQGIIHNIIDKFKQEYMGLAATAGQLMEGVSMGSDLIANGLDKLGWNWSDKTADVIRNATGSKGYQDLMQSFLANQYKELVYPYQNTKVYKQTKFDEIQPPKMSFWIYSSKSLANWLQQTKHYNRPFDLKESQTSAKDIDNLVNNDRKYFEGTITDTGKKSIDYTNNTVSFAEVNEKPVKVYINYLINRFAGSVSMENKITLDFVAPISYSDVKLFSQLFNGSNHSQFKERINNQKTGTFWMSVGDLNKPVHYYNLVPKSISVTPSKVYTDLGDYLYAQVDIDFEMSGTITTELVAKMLNPANVKVVTDAGKIASTLSSPVLSDRDRESNKKVLEDLTKQKDDIDARITSLEQQEGKEAENEKALLIEYSDVLANNIAYYEKLGLA